MTFVPISTAIRASGGDRGLLSRLEAPTGTKGCASLLSRLVSPTGTKLLGPLIPFPLPPPEPFSSLVLAVFGSGERSSCSFLHHICEDL